MFFLDVDFNSQEAIYLQLRNQIIVAIAEERLVEGESLPSVRQLADKLGVNMHTVNKAYSILKQDGYLKLDRRKGAVISVEEFDKENTVDSIYSDLKMIIAEAICKNIKKEDMQIIVNEMYDAFEKVYKGGKKDNE